MSSSVAAPRRTHRRRSAWALLGSFLPLAVAGALLPVLPASAAPAAPVVTSPQGNVTGAVEVVWRAVPGASGYEVQIDDSSSFSSPEWRSSTVGTISVPTSPLAPGTQHVRVRALEGRTGGAWSTSSFVVSALPGPSLTSPADGTRLAQPSQPPLLTWTPVEAATSYTVEIDTDSDFVGAKTYANVKSTSFVVPDNQAPDVTYHWRVRATLDRNIFTDHSAARTYTVLPLPAPVVTGPGNDVDVTDVVLDWQPVPGAEYYELQVDDDYDFNSLERGVPGKIYGTRFSPTTTFGNDQYYWRVRAVDADGNPTAWMRLPDGEHYEFNRVWRDTPQLVHPKLPVPTDRQTVVVGDDLYFEWTPVRHASHYELWVSQDINFTTSNRTTKSCQIVGTTYTPGELNDPCMPQSEGTVYYWKVRAMDLPYTGGGVDGIFSAAQRFEYDSTQASGWQIDASAAGKKVQVPTLDWEPVENSLRYKVELLRPHSTDSAQSVTTHSTSWTPSSKVAAGAGYRWRLTALDAAGRPTTTITTPWTFEVADVVGTHPRPEPIAGVPTYDAPQLRWQAVAGATEYRVSVRDTGSSAWFASNYSDLTKTSWAYPSATDSGTQFLAEGEYEYQVSAYGPRNAFLGAGDIGVFEVLPLDVVKGQRIALSGSALDRGAVCAKQLTSATNWCDSVPTTPVLDWEPVPYASSYRVHVSRDADFTTGQMANTPPETTNTRWAPRWSYPFKALPDSQASTAYYWFIQPCKSSAYCGPDPRSVVRPAKNAFRKTSPAINLRAPAHQANPTTPTAVVDATEVNFTWEDYYDTNRATGYVETGERSHQSAHTYRLEVATDPTFATTIETVTIDQPTYTSASKLYPEGTLYWRVQAIDAEGNRLTWSDSRTFVKRSSAPTLTSPVSDTVATGTTPFRWQSQAFAQSYEIQVAANNDLNFSRGNLVVDKSSKRPAFTTGFGTATLPTSATPYVWRVRRVDAAGNRGAWSQIGRFTVRNDAPQLISPTAGATVAPNALTMRWRVVPGTSRSRVSYREVGSSSVTTTTTSATSFAPTKALSRSTAHEWRVEALDADGKVIGDSGWRGFRTAGAPSTVAKVKSKTTMKVKKKTKTKRKKTARVVVNITVRATGAKPTGEVRVLKGKRVLGKAKLKKNGKAKIRTKALKRGKHKLRVRYVGNSSVKASSTKVTTIRVVR